MTSLRSGESEAGSSRDGASALHFDVLVVGAGISGIGAGYHLSQDCPDKSFVVLEAQETFGGTWWTHRYPGVRSDSDLFTFGYRFKPWLGAPIASAEEILKYLGDVIAENGLASHIRYRHRIVEASWSSDLRLWTLSVVREDTGERLTFTTNFLWMCQGYYRHGDGFTPDWPGMDRFSGRIVHPQEWPDDLDLAGKNVIVIGSGATAATLTPAIAAECARVTVLQRSPTYYFSAPNSNEVADMLRELEIPEEWVHEIVRRKVLHDQQAIIRLSFEQPEFLKTELIKLVRDRLPPGYDVEKHFTPAYRPWRQRIALLPDGDLLAEISSGKVTMITGEIRTFTESGILLMGGEELDADIIITATGFDLSLMGDIDFTIDGEPLDLADTVTYRGVMFTGVPNLAWVFGYFRVSWTLRADLISDLVCRLLAHMAAVGARKVTPQLRPEDADMPILPWVDPENFNPGYLMRSADLLPKRGDKPEWQHSQDYWTEKDLLPNADLGDGCLAYE
jgi:cation diffusion facilitator CzcD-associated flavoprotein CzcO